MKSLQDTLTEIKALCEKATPGPWEAVPNVGAISRSSREGGDEDVIEATRYLDKDLYFIAASRTLIPALLAALEKACEQRDGWFGAGDKDSNYMIEQENAELASILASLGDLNQARGRGDVGHLESQLAIAAEALEAVICANGYADAYAVARKALAKIKDGRGKE